MNLNFTPRSLYRLPWNFSDNAISWLEPTSMCNLYCDGCYRENRKGSHKSLHEVQHELDVFERLRNCDSVSIAGRQRPASPRGLSCGPWPCPLPTPSSRPAADGARR